MAKKEPSSSNVAQLDKGELKRVLGVSDLFAIGYGDLGSSLFYALGITALYALGATPIALALAGVVFICTALTYAEMCSSFHESGGSASFARHAFNDLISFIAGWGLLLDYIVTIAISAFTIAPYLSLFWDGLSVNYIQTLFTILVVGILCIINIFGVKQSTRLSFFLTSGVLLTEAAIIGIGLILLFNLPFLIEHVRINVPNVDWSPSWHDFWKGTAMAMVAYTGIESIAQLGAEAKLPARTVPRAIMVTMGILVVASIGIAVVALSAISPQELSTKYLENPIAGIVAALPIGSKFLAPWVGILTAALLFVAANAGLMGASRLSFNMGQYYQLPKFFSRLHGTFRTPATALVFFSVLAVVVVLACRGNIMFLADLYNFGAMIAFFFAHLSLIVMRIKKPDLKRPFKVPFNIKVDKYEIPIPAVVGFLSTFAVWVLIIITKPDGRYLGLSWMAVGIVMYFMYRRKQRISATGQLEIERISVPDYKPLLIKKILVPTGGSEQTATIQMACELARLHGAKLTALHVIEVPFSMPIDSEMTSRLMLAQAALKRAEAIARELNVQIDVEVIRSRSVKESILDFIKKGKFDLCVMGSLKEKKHTGIGLGALTEKVLKEASCRVWVCTEERSSF